MAAGVGVVFASGRYELDVPAARPFFQELVDAAAFVVCADGGANAMRRIGRVPHLIVGDMDSISADARDALAAVPRCLVPADKDFTDTELAIEKALEHGVGELVLCGVVGTRVDHSLTNVMMLLRLADRGVRARIVGYATEAFVCRPEERVVGRAGWTCSLVALSPVVRGVTLHGFRYGLTGEDVERGKGRTCSNVVASPDARIEKKDGELLVVLTRPDFLD